MTNKKWFMAAKVGYQGVMSSGGIWLICWLGMFLSNHSTPTKSGTRKTTGHTTRDEALPRLHLPPGALKSWLSQGMLDRHTLQHILQHKKQRVQTNAPCTTNVSHQHQPGPGTCTLDCRRRWQRHPNAGPPNSAQARSGNVTRDAQSRIIMLDGLNLYFQLPMSFLYFNLKQKPLFTP